MSVPERFSPGTFSPEPAQAPASTALPADTLILDGPDSVTALGGPAGLLTALQRVLDRPGPAVVVATSGSTGRPKRTVLSTESLRASADATAEHTGGPGQWLLCLPSHYVAGVQVLVRSALADTEPVIMTGDHFTVERFVAAGSQLTHPTRYVSLVPTQLQRLMSAATENATDQAVAQALRSFTAILLGGSAASPALLEQARELGARVVTTYGMSETAGGCVYDGAPLPGVRVHLEQGDQSEPGRIWLGGDVVTDGYLDDPDQTARHVFTDGDGTRWYRTDDLGELATDGSSQVLRVISRADDVIVTGGVKVSAGVVRTVLVKDPRVQDAVVVALPDEVWGQRIVALVVPRTAGDGQALERELSTAVRDAAGAAAVPKDWRTRHEIPLLATGKPDLAAVRSLFA